MDVNMSVLEGGIGIFPRRLLVHADDLEDAQLVMRDNGLPVSDRG
ncbi:conserved domain protein [Ruegeria sp. TrichCH4B]|nr:conserved domain protein [Ruegeria sp. TrichCH4B]